MVKPLLSELKLKDIVYDRMAEKQRIAERNLKIMNSILRIPLMCDQFQKSVRRKAEAH